MRRARVWSIPAIALLAAAVLAGCGGGSDGGSATDAETSAEAAPAACQAPPVTMVLEAGGEYPAGSEAFEVVDAAARRVAILPEKMAFDPAELSGLESEAGVTPLALYTLYLADFELETEQLASVGLSQVSPAAGQTVGALTVVPLEEAGLAQGDVVVDGELNYQTVTSFSPLGLTVFTDGETTPQSFSDLVGQVEVLQLNDQTICLDIDVTFSSDGELVYRAAGTVSAPVVRSSNAFFFT